MSKNTRCISTLEELRKRFVEKFEGYRLQTEAEMEDGVYPRNFSAVPLGRGHADRMAYNPFPVPTLPGTRLSTAKYAAILSALLYDYSLIPPSRPLVEYYVFRSPDPDGGYTLEPWTASRILRDIWEKDRLVGVWPCGGNFKQRNKNEVFSLISAILDRLSPVLWCYEPCIPVSYDRYGYQYEECVQ